MGLSPVVRRRAGAVALAVVAVALVWALLSGGGEPEDAPVPIGAPSASATTESTTTEEATEPDPVDAETEALVEGLMLVGFEGSDPAAALDELDARAYGGVLIASANWAGKGPGTQLIRKLRKGLDGGGGPPLMVTRQEGGDYRSFPDLPPEQREIEIGDRGRPKLAEDWAEQGAKALAAAGIDVNLAPVADVATLDSAIADRAFSDDPGVAAEMTSAAVEGCEKGGIACAVSHFPGLGAASQDTEIGPASIGLDPQTIRARDLIPFREAFQAGVPAVVVSHGLYAAFDPVTPATLSGSITTNLLRNELGFEGVAISDDIGAGAIAAVNDPGAAAVTAVTAGIDLLQVADPADVEKVRRALLAAVADGTLSVARLEEATARTAELRE